MENVEKILEISGGDSDSCRSRSIYASVDRHCTVNAASISLNKKSLTLAAKDRYTLKLAGAKNVSWAGKNKAVASVSKKGLVTAKKAGKTVIHCLL